MSDASKSLEIAQSRHGAYTGCSGRFTLQDQVRASDDWRCSDCGTVIPVSYMELSVESTAGRSHVFVRGAEDGPDRKGPPDETCAVCQCDPRNEVHQATMAHPKPPVTSGSLTPEAMEAWQREYNSWLQAMAKGGKLVT